jgi:hypothetical protein
VTDPNEQIRAIIERPIGALVEIGLEGGERAALHMLAFQYILRIDLADDLETLLALRQELDAAIASFAELKH